MAENKARMPVLFVGHGSPENAIEKNEFSLGWKKIAQEFPKPKLILCISAHWLTEGTAITAMENPKTIHDFYGFQKALYAMQYPAAGSPEFAKTLKQLISKFKPELDYEWGLDHGAWSVLVNMFPAADIPVVQLSLNSHLPLSSHLELGKALSSLRDEGVLIIGSGNVVHNLMVIDPSASPYAWAEEFDKFVKEKLQKGDSDSLINYTKQEHAALALPTNEHYLPLLYALGAAGSDKPKFFNEKIVYGSISMRCVAYGLKK